MSGYARIAAAQVATAQSATATFAGGYTAPNGYGVTAIVVWHGTASQLGSDPSGWNPDIKVNSGSSAGVAVYHTVSSGSVAAFTANLTATVPFLRVILIAYPTAGAAVGSVDDVQATTSHTSAATTTSVGPVTTNHATEVALAIVNLAGESGGFGAVPSGFEAIDTTGRSVVAERVVASSGTSVSFAVTWTTSRTGRTVLITYRVAAAASSSPPVANAGPDQVVNTGQSNVTLTGTITDPDSTVTSRLWSQVSGPAVTLTGATTATATFTAPATPATLVFSHTGVAGGETAPADTVTVTVVDPDSEISPISSAGDGTVTGAATAHAALADTTDGSFVELSPGDVYAFRMESITDPGVSTGHVTTPRVEADATTETLLVQLVEGASGATDSQIRDGGGTVRQSRTVSSLPPDFEYRQLALTSQEADSITSAGYGRLWVRLTNTST